MNKIKVGVYLAAKPSAGGIFQYALSIIDALNQLNKEVYEIHFFVKDKSWEEYFPSHGFIHIANNTFVYRVLSRLSRAFLSFKKANEFAFIFNPSIRQINRSKCDLVIYPSQDNVSYQSKTNALTAIHDLMHRYEPHFEEYQNGVYEVREQHYKEVCKISKGILVDSNMGKKHVVESYEVNQDKVFVLPFVPPFNLVNIEPIDIRSKYGLNNNFIFYPAQFWEHKNHINLILAFKKITQRNIDLQLVLVGSKKNNYNKVIELINELEMHDNIMVLGYVSDQELVSLYKSAVAMVFPSLLGPTNIPPVEALLLGCPLLVSNAYAMPEQVADCALLFDPKNVEDIANKIEKIINEKSLRNELISKGKEHIKKWTRVDFNQRLENILNILHDDK